MNKYFLLAMIMTLLGCATTPEECDPSAGGFIKGVSCKVSGAYDERIKQREETLSDLQKQQELLGTAKGKLETEYTAKSQLVVEEREEVRQLGIQLNDFQARLDSVVTRTRREQNQQQALLTQLANLQAKSRRLKAALAQTSLTAREYEQAKRENEQLRAELNVLMEKATAAQM